MSRASSVRSVSLSHTAAHVASNFSGVFSSTRQRWIAYRLAHVADLSYVVVANAPTLTITVSLKFRFAGLDLKGHRFGLEVFDSECAGKN